MATVETRGIKKLFGDVAAVNGVSLLTRDGEFLVLLGPSGCGKSTLLRMIAGFEIPTEGELLIGGKVMNDLPPRARKIAMVFQSYALYPHMTVFKNIAFPLKAQGVARSLIPQKVDWAATLFGIGHLLARKPRELQRRIGTTTIYVTHDQVEAMGLGDRIVVMKAGTVRQIGTPEEIYDDPADTFVAGFVGSPPMNLVRHRDYILGFRPENFHPKLLNSNTKVVTFHFNVTRVEYLGADRLIYGTLIGDFSDQKVIGRLPATVTVKIEPATSYDFTVPESELKFFDAATELRIAPRSV